MAFENAALLLAWGAILLLALAMAGILTQVKTLTASSTEPVPRPSGPAAGFALPQELLPPPTTGEELPSLLLFADASCRSCSEIQPDILRMEEEGRYRVGVIYRGTGSHGDGPHWVLENQSEAFSRLRVPATPFAVIATASGQVESSALVGSPTALAAFVAANDNVARAAGKPAQRTEFQS